MRILYFHQHFSTPQGAAGLRSYWMARRLIEKGHRVTMVCGSYSVGASGVAGAFTNGVRQGTVDGIEVIEFDLAYSNSDSFSKRTRQFLKYAWRSTRLVFTQPYDLIFASTTPLTAGIPGIVAKVLRRKPFVFEVRDLWPELPKAMGVITNPAILAAMSLLEWSSYKAADQCIGLSPGIVEGIERRGVSPSQTTMIPNGSDIQLFSDPDIVAWQPEGVLDSNFVAVFAGSHGIANGLDAVLDAGAELKRRGRTDILLVMIGSGKLKEGLQARALREQLSSCLFIDPVEKTRLAGLLKRADAGMMILANIPAFYFGTSPNKFFEYIAAGLPVVNNYPGWLAGMIQDNECGLAVPPEDPKAFCDALEQLADDAPLRARMRANCKKLAGAQFDWRMLSDQFCEVIETTRK